MKRHSNSVVSDYEEAHLEGKLRLAVADVSVKHRLGCLLDHCYGFVFGTEDGFEFELIPAVNADPPSRPPDWGGRSGLMTRRDRLTIEGQLADGARFRAYAKQQDMGGQGRKFRVFNIITDQLDIHSNEKFSAEAAVALAILDEDRLHFLDQFSSTETRRANELVEGSQSMNWLRYEVDGFLVELQHDSGIRSQCSVTWTRDAPRIARLSLSDCLEATSRALSLLVGYLVISPVVRSVRGHDIWPLSGQLVGHGKPHHRVYADSGPTRQKSLRYCF